MTFTFSGFVSSAHIVKGL